MVESRHQEPPDSDEFKAGSVQKAIWSEALQHPTTLVPAAVAILSGAYMGLIGLDQTAFALALGGGLASLASVVYHYFIRGEDYAAAHVAKLLARREQVRDQATEALEERCNEIGFREGAQQAGELREAYNKLLNFLNESESSSGVTRFSHLARDCYKEGLRLLELALGSYRVLREIDFAKLTREKEDWEKQAAVMAVS